ncbi:MAG: hypothetical protein F6K19_05395 [Cyanothece sp. SIO1E1]|nr:hypothetical protein [Cyanothece sp. SIO1E1]
MLPTSAALEQALKPCHLTWLRVLLTQHLPTIWDLEDTPQGHALAQQWDAFIKQKFAARGLKSLQQQKNPITIVRSCIKAIRADHPALTDVGFSPEEWMLINAPLEQKVSDRSTQLIDNPLAIADRAEGLLDSATWAQVAAGLVVTTGRRRSEILLTATFTPQSAWSVWFTGALKRRGEQPELGFEIPTLVKADKVITALTRLRTQLDCSGLDVSGVNRRYAHSVAVACNEYFADLVPVREGQDSLYTHLFRAVYSTIAAHWYCPPQVPELEFRAAIQGHYKVLDHNHPELRRDLAASRHYYDYRISDGQGNIDGRLGVQLGKPGVEVLEVFRRHSTMTAMGDDWQRIPAMEDDTMSTIATIRLWQADKDTVIALQRSWQLDHHPEAIHQVIAWAQVGISLAKRLNCHREDLHQVIEQLQTQAALTPNLTQQLAAAQAIIASLQTPIQQAQSADSGSTTHYLAEAVARLTQQLQHQEKIKAEHNQLRLQLETVVADKKKLQHELDMLQQVKQQFQALSQVFGNGQIEGGATTMQINPVEMEPIAIASQRPQIETVTTTITTPPPLV